MTLAELRTLFRIYVNDAGSDRFTDAEVLLFLNRGMEDVQEEFDLVDEDYFTGCQDFTVAPTTDSYEFTLPPTVKDVTLVERLVPGSVPVRLWWKNFNQRHDEHRDFSSVGPGTFVNRCYLRGNKFGVVSPSESYTARMWFTKRLTLLANDADEPEIPPEHQELIVLHAAKRAMAAEDAPFDKWQDLFDEKKFRLQEHIIGRQVQQPRHVNMSEDSY